MGTAQGKISSVLKMPEHLVILDTDKAMIRPAANVRDVVPMVYIIVFFRANQNDRERSIKLKFSVP
jgi:hypothetical protein